MSRNNKKVQVWNEARDYVPGGMQSVTEISEEEAAENKRKFDEIIYGVKGKLEEATKLEELGDHKKLLDWANSYTSKDTPELILKKVVEIYERLVQLGDGLAMNNLGSMYYNGVYFDVDYNKAAKYYSMACDKGVDIAFGNLACVYYYGNKELKDYEKCRDILMKGAVLFNNVECYMRLGDLYRYGRGVEKNDTYAFNMYTKAFTFVDKKNPNSLLGDIRVRIGECFLEGIGIEMNSYEALYNFSLAMPALYAKLDNDPYVMSAIKKAKKGLKEAESLLENRI